MLTCALQRHKLGTNLTPVTPETFAKWKKTRMDKKQAEDEALKKAKDTQAAAGKNSGMSGRDLVSTPRMCLPRKCLTTPLVHIQPGVVPRRGRGRRRLGPCEVSRAARGGRPRAGRTTHTGPRLTGRRLVELNRRLIACIYAHMIRFGLSHPASSMSIHLHMPFSMNV